MTVLAAAAMTFETFDDRTINTRSRTGVVRALSSEAVTLPLLTLLRDSVGERAVEATQHFQHFLKRWRFGGIFSAGIHEFAIEQIAGIA